jgi:transcriptional regulator with XRE-family HTH domain
MIKQLADAINESVSAIELLEKGVVPEKSLDLVRKLEQFFNIRLIKRQPEEVIMAESSVVLRTPDWVKRAQEKTDYEKKIQEQEGEDMVREAILSETNPEILDKEEINGRPLSVMNFQKAKDANPKILELRRIQRLVDQDSPKKTSFETGEEQMSGFGKEDTDRLKKIVYKEEKTPKSDTPTIYDLMKKKEDKERDTFE